MGTVVVPLPEVTEVMGSTNTLSDLGGEGVRVFTHALCVVSIIHCRLVRNVNVVVGVRVPGGKTLCQFTSDSLH